MKKLMTVIGLALVMCLLVSFSCAAPPAPMAPAPGQYPKIIDEGIYAIPPKIIDEGIFARPDDSWWSYSPKLDSPTNQRR